MGVEETTPLLSECCSKRLEELKDGETVTTPGGCVAEMEVPPWLDKAKFYRAGDVYKRYFASINFSHLCGLLLSFYFTKNIETLKSTGMSSTIKNLFNRYVTTTRYVQSWYEGDVWDPNDKAHKTLASVRAMHCNAANRMAARNDGIVYVSQWDMALTQWAFVGPMVLFPTQLGLHGLTEEELDSLVHFWRGIGYLLGVEDKYNLCAGTYDDIVRTCREVLDKEYSKRVAEANPISVTMCSDVSTAFNKLDPLLTWGFLSNYIHDLVDMQCPVRMGFYDWICYEFTWFMMRIGSKYAPVRSFMNDMARWRLDKAESEKGPYGRIKIDKLSACPSSAKAA